MAVVFSVMGAKNVSLSINQQKKYICGECGNSAKVYLPFHFQLCRWNKKNKHENKLLKRLVAMPVVS